MINNREQAGKKRSKEQEEKLGATEEQKRV
jgi:hypothetical protein